MYRLRELCREDLGIINKWRNDPELISMLGAPFRYINQDVDAAWYENYMASRGNTVRCAIVGDNSDKILGLVSLTGVDYLNQSATFHIMIGDVEAQGKGAGTYAIKAMLYHAFNNMNLQRVELTVLESNKRACHVYEKCGFQYEGRKRNAGYKNGGFVNMLEYAILKSEYMALECHVRLEAVTSEYDIQDSFESLGGGIGQTYTRINCLQHVFFRRTAKQQKIA